MAGLLVDQAGSPPIHTSPFGVISKRGRNNNRWSLILDLSSPHGHIVNDGIEKELASLTYVSVDEVVQKVLRYIVSKNGYKAGAQKRPSSPEDLRLLGMCWEGSTYIDAMLPFGLRSAPLIFSAVVDAVAWIMSQHVVSWLDQYIDDLISAGCPSTTECARITELMHTMCRKVGMPVEPENDQGPATTITFLGLKLDTVALEVRLPQDKLANLRTLLRSWLGRKACGKRELLTLIGSMSHAL